MFFGLPVYREIKHRLTGPTQEFACGRLRYEATGAAAALLFVSDRPRAVADLPLPVGTVTFAYFWSDRPYNAYHWMDAAGATLGLYFNVADSTTIGPDELVFRDLVVDVLVRPEGVPVVLDRDELPAELPFALHRRIEAATERVLAEIPALRDGLENESTAHWRQVFGTPRAVR